MPAFNFRNTILLAQGTRLSVNTDEQVIVLSEDPPRVEITPVPPHIRFLDTEKLEMRGGPYATDSEAIEAGRTWRKYLLVAFAEQRIGIDLGAEHNPIAEPMGYVADAGKKLGVQALRDRHGLLVFPSDLDAAFGRFFAEAMVSRDAGKITSAVEQVQATAPKVSDPHLLALRLLHSSFFDTNPETRFVLLVTAIEAVIETKQRSPQILDLLEQFRAVTKSASLTSGDRDALLNALGNAKSETISAAGRRLVALLTDREYDGQAPAEFFVSCYNARSKIVHGSLGRPSRERLERLIPVLEAMVVDLLGALTQGTSD
ncbi:hypothetical protein ACQP0C_41800 (plasmid) [Nocardia sp. CA-129566]|uniref:hypothetical protein n=1 Tax=Nocardia sp. CA-129566 TaxID=3239976 RepID=UPI003D97CE76